MATIENLANASITEKNHLLNSVKTTVETAFYGNNVQAVIDLQDAYDRANQAPGTIVTDMSVKHTQDLGLPDDAKVLVYNNGKIVGRTAAARVIAEYPETDTKQYEGIIREAIFEGRAEKFLKTEVYVGLDADFMMKSHLMIPEEYANSLYSYMLNFQVKDAIHDAMYQASNQFDENDIYIYADPNWQHPDFPNGLAFFDQAHNVAIILGLSYFGELKKGTLTLAWATAHRNGFVSAHGGMKQYQLADKTYTMAAFGLSGSGKSTITFAPSKRDEQIEILHDDAFVINKTDASATALEPSYFDKTQDYDLTKSSVDYFLTCQNVGVTLNESGEKVPVLRDIRNSNGRAVKSRFMTKNRTDHLASALDAVYWIMKDDSLPPVLKITDPVIAAAFGVTLATKRSSAENIVNGFDKNKLVIEPFANPFRVYPLGEDYQDFRTLFEELGTACYVINTGYFGNKKVTPDVTLDSIDDIVHHEAKFVPYGGLDELLYLEIPGYEVDFSDTHYREKVVERLQTRLNFMEAQTEYNILPGEAKATMAKLIDKLA